MATYTRTEQTRTTVEFRVPAGPLGACWTDVLAAIYAAQAELNRADPETYPRASHIPSDVIRVLPVDDAVLVTYVRPAPGRTVS